KGEKLGVVLPTGELKIVAQFSPSAGFGRIRPGQKARVRVQGFPWTQYGELTATVTNVAGETRDGLVRVELAILPTSSNLIPLQHGLPAVVEVEVEHLSPASLVLRSAGYGAESTSPATPVPISGGGAR
ncbi:MAG TPA: HlyD family secretion protein, partial [Acidobacteriota bacterium]|nr:HlyD family secretion protein [Acidobacteriota bacterium]